MRMYLPGFLFRKETSFSPYRTGQGPLSEGQASGKETDPALASGQDATSCRELCELAGRCLAAGFLPEALARYKSAVEMGCPETPEPCRPRLGILKVYVAMGRFADARRTFLSLAHRRGSEPGPELILIDGILAAFAERYEYALGCFSRAGRRWYLCPNLEAIAGYVLFREGRYEDARNVFRVAAHSPWADLRDFGLLGVADCFAAQKEWSKAQALYEALAEGKSPLGLLGLAELHLDQGKPNKGLPLLNELAASARDDYWRGVALAYLISLKVDRAEWAEAIGLSRKARALVLPDAWARVLREKTVAALEGRMKALWDAGSYEALLMLVQDWEELRGSMSLAAQILVARVYEQLGLYGPAIEMFSRFSSDPDTLYRAARLAWKSQRYGKAEDLLERYLDSRAGTAKDDARVLLACLQARSGRLDLAKRTLRGVKRIQDPELWVVLGSVEASMGMDVLAVTHLRIGLEKGAFSEQERQHLLRTIGRMSYLLGRYDEALRSLRLAAGPEGSQGTTVDPIEVLCLHRLGKSDRARAHLGRLQAGEEAGWTREILDSDDLVRSLRQDGYVF